MSYFIEGYDLCNKDSRLGTFDTRFDPSAPYRLQYSTLSGSETWLIASICGAGHVRARQSGEEREGQPSAKRLTGFTDGFVGSRGWELWGGHLIMHLIPLLTETINSPVVPTYWGSWGSWGSSPRNSQKG